jgi:hypothetical protein
MTRKLLTAAIMAIALLVLLAACGGDDPTPTPTPTAEPQGLSVTLVPIQDNTLFEDEDGELSNGSGTHLFAGNTEGRGGRRARRALIQFDVAAALPEYASVTSATLNLRMTRSRLPTGVPVSLHRMLADWGEGASNALAEEGRGTAAGEGDVTWTHRTLGGEAWTTPGGDFVADASGATDVAGIEWYAWESTEAMVADVQGWYGDPASNFGWIVVGDESAVGTAKRFGSRESGEETAPTLRIHYFLTQ